MRRTSIVWPTLAMMAMLSSALLFAQPSNQQSPARNRRGGQPGNKPGEVIAPPDRSERWVDQLQVGRAAPEFTLPLLDDGDKSAAAEMVSLRDLRTERPVVLIFGSISCPPFRGQLDGVDDVYKQFRDRAEFLFVYIREAHPDSVLSVVGADGRESLRQIPQAVELTARTETAAACQRTASLEMPIAIDIMDNRVGKAYAGWPNRMVVVGTDGNILYASPGSPRGTDATRLRTWLEQNLPKPE